MNAACRTRNKKYKKRVPLRAVKNIQKKEGRSDRSVSDNQSSSVTLNELAMKAKITYCSFEFQQRSHTMTDINPNGVQMT